MFHVDHLTEYVQQHMVVTLSLCISQERKPRLGKVKVLVHHTPLGTGETKVWNQTGVVSNLGSHSWELEQMRSLSTMGRTPTT